MPAQAMGSPGGDLSVLISVLSAEPVSSLHLPAAMFVFFELLSCAPSCWQSENLLPVLKPSKN